MTTPRPQWLNQFDQAWQAGYRGIILAGNANDLVYVKGQSEPPCQVKMYLARYLQQHGYHVWSFSLAYGLQHVQPSSARNATAVTNVLANLADPKSFQQVASVFTRVLRQREQKTALIADYADHLCPSSRGMNIAVNPEQLTAIQTFHAWGNDEAILASENMVILVSYEYQVNELLMQTGSGYRLIMLDLPCEEDRLAFTELLLEARQKGRARDFADLEKGFEPKEFAQRSAGLRLRDIVALFQQAAAQGNSVSRSMLREHKAAVLRQINEGLLEVKEPDYGLDKVGGLHHLKTFVERLRWRFGAVARDVPQAILLAGVPGCGKSYIVMAIAKELQIPCLVMRNIREQWVGRSEQNLERVLHIIENLTPCLVWIDEIDQVLGQRSTQGSLDAGTSERILARLWEFMGAMRHRGRILWVATTNRPDILDAATVDRFPVCIPIIHPSLSDVKEMLPILAEQLGRELKNTEPTFNLKLPEFGTPLTVRALQEIMARAVEMADEDAKKVCAPIRPEHIERAANLYKPNYNPALHQFIALTALQMSTFKDLLPWWSENGPQSVDDVPDYIKELLTPNSDLDTIKVYNRIRELQQQLNLIREARNI